MTTRSRSIVYWTMTGLVAFFIGGGVLSHWQIWGAFAVSAEVCAWRLRRGAAARVPAAIG